MSLFNWPFKRKQYAGLENPRFVSDIVAANEATIDSAAALCGVSDTDFFIISGFEFVPGIPNTYTPGIIFFNGNFYVKNGPFAEGLYLSPTPVDTMLKAFGDGTSRNTYTINYCVATSSPDGATVVFSGNMNQYRLNLKILKESISTINAFLTTLGNAATRNVGTASGTVMAGDDSRVTGLVNNVLKLDNTGVYTPSGDYNPATKKYVQDSVGNSRVIFIGYTNLGSVVTQKNLNSLTVTVANLGSARYRVTHNLGNKNYFVTAQCRGEYFYGSISEWENNYFTFATGFGGSTGTAAEFFFQIHQYI